MPTTALTAKGAHHREEARELGGGQRAVLDVAVLAGRGRALVDVGPPVAPQQVQLPVVVQLRAGAQARAQRSAYACRQPQAQGLRLDPRQQGMQGTVISMRRPTATSHGSTPGHKPTQCWTPTNFSPPLLEQITQHLEESRDILLSQGTGLACRELPGERAPPAWRR